MTEFKHKYFMSLTKIERLRVYFCESYENFRRIAVHHEILQLFILFHISRFKFYFIKPKLTSNIKYYHLYESFDIMLLLKTNLIKFWRNALQRLQQYKILLYFELQVRHVLGLIKF